MTIREFYLKNYPTDDLGLELAETPTFAGLLNQLIWVVMCTDTLVLVIVSLEKDCLRDSLKN